MSHNDGRFADEPDDDTRVVSDHADDGTVISGGDRDATVVVGDRADDRTVAAAASDDDTVPVSGPVDDRTRVVSRPRVRNPVEQSGDGRALVPPSTDDPDRVQRYRRRVFAASQQLRGDNPAPPRVVTVSSPQTIDSVRSVTRRTARRRLFALVLVGALVIGGLATALSFLLTLP